MTLKSRLPDKTHHPRTRDPHARLHPITAFMGYNWEHRGKSLFLVFSIALPNLIGLFFQKDFPGQSEASHLP